MTFKGLNGLPNEGRSIIAVLLSKPNVRAFRLFILVKIYSRVITRSHYLVGDNFTVAAISVVRICLSFGISLAFPTSMSTITTITMSISMIVGRIVWVMVVARSYRLSTNLFP